MQKPRKYTRKGKCPNCNVRTGSSHGKACPWRYVPEPNSKTRKFTFCEKIKTIIQIIKP